MICLDTGCIMIIVDRDWIKKLRSDLEIHYIEELINVRGVDIVKYPSNEYVIFNFFIQGLINGEIQLLEVTAEVYLVVNF